MLTPAEQLGLAGAALDARVRQAVNFIPDSTLVHVARRLAEDARASDVVYVHDGTVETVRVMLRPLLVMPEQLGYLHHVCTRIMSALARFPELYARDADVRRACRSPTTSARGSTRCGPPSRTRRRRSTAGSTPSAISRARAGRTRCASWSRTCRASAASISARSPRRS